MLRHVISPITGSPACRTSDEDTAARIALALAGVAGAPSVADAIDSFGSAAKLVAAVHDRTDAAIPLTPLVRRRIRALATGVRVAVVLEESKRTNITAITPSHTSWPPQLCSMRGAAPLLLWVRGEANSLAMPSIALTGTRAPTAYGVRMAIELATGLAGRGWALIAGAEGEIGQIVMRSAVAMNGKAIMVAASGLDRLPAPDDGVIYVSELPPGFTSTFLSRRRAEHLVAALGAKTIIVEAGVASSVMRTAEAAQAMKRPVGIVPGPAPTPFNSDPWELAQWHASGAVTSTLDADWLL
ncbi:hypothetical protein BH10ACT7_BH10ACT7_20830 [soil metagenome]